MSHPVLSLEKHLTNIYARLEKMEDAVAVFAVKLDSFVRTTTDEIDRLGREKLPTQEFREFVDMFNKSLTESLASQAEKPSQTEAKLPKSEPSGENVGNQGEAVQVQSS